MPYLKNRKRLKEVAEMEKESKNTKKKAVIIGLAVLVIGVIGVMGAVIYRLMNKEEAPRERAVSSGLIVDENDIDQKAANARFTTDMNMIWVFKSGSRISYNAVIGNASDNEYECYFEVYLDDEDQTLLYSSPVLPVGKRLDLLTLDKGLPDGIYEAVCTYHLLDDEDPETELGTVSFNVSLMFGQ